MSPFGLNGLILDVFSCCFFVCFFFVFFFCCFFLSGIRTLILNAYEDLFQEEGSQTYWSSIKYVLQLLVNFPTTRLQLITLTFRTSMVRKKGVLICRINTVCHLPWEDWGP